MRSPVAPTFDIVRSSDDPAVEGNVEEPSCERPGGFSDVGLAVFAGSQGVELHDLSGEILVDRLCVVLGTVEVDQHRRILGHGREQI